MAEPWSMLCESLADGKQAGADMQANTDRLRRLAGQLQAGEAFEARWLGERLGTWLQRGGDLPSLLGVRGPRGSRVTPQLLVQRDRRDLLLMRLSNLAGGDANALRMLRGELTCSDVDLISELQSVKCPISKASFSRSRARFTS